MDNAVKPLQKGVSSKEYKELIKCASDHCKDYEQMLKEEQNLVNELVKLQTGLMKPKTKSVSPILDRVKEVLNRMILLLELNENKKDTMCVIKECGKEYVDVVANKSKHMQSFYKDQIKNMDKAINKITKMKLKEQQKK